MPDAGEYDYTRICAHVHKQSMIFFGNTLKEFGINAGQFPPLMCVCEYPGLTQEQIAEQTKTDKSTVAKMIKQLMEAGLIVRKGNPDDKRSYHIFPTRKALKIYPGIAEKKRRWHESLTRNLTGAEKAILGMLLDKLNL